MQFCFMTCKNIFQNVNFCQFCNATAAVSRAWFSFRGTWQCFCSRCEPGIRWKKIICSFPTELMCVFVWNNDLKLPHPLCTAYHRLLFRSFINKSLFYSASSPTECPLAQLRSTHNGAIVDAECLQCPGQSQAHQDVKHITADGVGDGHVSHTWGKESNIIKVCKQSGGKH